MATQYVPVSLIGVPTDIGAGHRGARMGPEALRIAGLHEALVGRGVEVRDLATWMARAIPGRHRKPATGIWTKWWPGTRR